MIGVVAHASEREVIGEFFELFKTPWEFARDGFEYDVALCTRPGIAPASARLVIVYGLEEGNLASLFAKQSSFHGPSSFLQFSGGRLPIYAGLITFAGAAWRQMVEATGRAASVVATGREDGQIIRVGYDLSAEIRHLLTVGQPVANAAIPALDLHMAILRELIVTAGLPLLEIPPVPDQHPFTVCLTHDVDHPVMRNHLLDATSAGFVYRATLGSCLGALRGRISCRNLIRNWAAACRLPFVYLGWVKDFWREALVAYARIEQGLGSTFFVIPFRGRPGRRDQGTAPAARGAKYGAEDIAGELNELVAAGCEVGLHGIDAWRDATAGREERDRIQVDTGRRELGVRMHWLYFNERSHSVLEAAGFSYDSTVGYNETPGFRAGTAQAFKPLGATRLMELPLHIMDTSLFYPDRMNLGFDEARRKIDEIIDCVVRGGGVLTINWHDRSIAPERLWGEFYQTLLDNLKTRGVWFPTASAAVEWFRKRRAVGLEMLPAGSGRLRVKVSSGADCGSPGLRLRVHRPVAPASSGKTPGESYFDMPLREGEMEFAI